MIGPREPDSDTPQPRFVRPYVITRGRSLPDERELSLITLVTAAEDQRQRPRHFSPEEQDLLRMCRGGYLSVAEIAGHSRLPMGIVKILLSGLVEGGHLVARPPVPAARLADGEILQEVLDGLRARFG
ncbi:protein of unknown function DUF742 [Actinobacteria bacterium OK074]|nr:protein of unknown function DUF742 [Actinobacteria bacterium OK074]